MKLFYKAIFFFILCLGNNITGNTQTTIWSENFETGYADNDAVAQDNNLPSGADWLKSGTPTNWWRVESDNVLAGSFSMSGRNTDGVMTWTSESIDISGYSNISISIDLKEINCEGVDIIETFYNIGAGNIEFGNTNGDGDFNSTNNTITGLNASSLVIVVTLNNNGGGERLIFDNILVTGTPKNGHLGPGGVGDIDGTGTLEYWIDANNSISGSSPITSWTDLSGNGVTNTIAGNPSLSSASLNGRDVVTFDGTADIINTNLDINAATHPDLDIYTVYSFNGTSGAIWGEDNGGYDRFLVDADGAGGCDFSIGIGSGCFDVAALFPASTPVISGIQFSEDTSSSVIIDGSSVTTFTPTQNPGTSNNFQIGGIGTSSYPLTGDIAELFVFSNNLNLAQQNILNNYLSAKYNISLDANDLYNEDDSGNFDFDVAGIGQASDGSSHLDAQGTGIVRVNTPSDLDDSEYLFWGHTNGALDSYLVSDLPTGIDSRIARQWRVSETGDIGTFNISFDLSDVGGAIDAADLRLLIDTDGDSLYNDESGAAIISGAVNTSGNIFQWSGVSISNNQGFSIGSVDDTDTPLPISLLLFQAEFNHENFVEVSWITSSEMNNDFFTIEKSVDGLNWTIVTTLNGAGNSNQELKYQIIDIEPFQGISYYRLMQTDFDGNFEIFDPVAVKNGLVISDVVDENVSIYPNPGNGNSVYMEFVNFKPGMYKINVIDESGRLILHRDLNIEEGSNYIEMELLHGVTLVKGIHFIRVSSLEKVITKKYIVY